MQVGDRIILNDEPDCIVPAGEYTVSFVDKDGSFRVGGNTAIWPRRVVAVLEKAGN